MTFGQRLNDIRKERNYSLKKLAIESHVPVTTIYSWLYYGKNPDLIRLVRIADALNMSLDELVGRQFPKGVPNDVEG